MPSDSQFADYEPLRPARRTRAREEPQPLRPRGVAGGDEDQTGEDTFGFGRARLRDHVENVRDVTFKWRTPLQDSAEPVTPDLEHRLAHRGRRQP